MKKKGFTLIELLAVIVILAVIALIATPLIMNVINDARKNSFKDSAYGITKAVELRVAKETMGEHPSPRYKVDVTSKAIDYSGDRPTEGWALVEEDGTIALYMCNSSYCAYKESTDKEIKVTTDKEEMNQVKTKMNQVKEETVTELTENGTSGAVKPVNNCTFDGELVQGAEYVNGQYTYRYMQEPNGPFWRSITLDGWSVMLTDKTSTDPVTTKLCTSINGKPIVSMSNMFAGSKSSGIDVSSFDTSNVTNMVDMFINATNLATLDLRAFDTSKVTNMSHMFSRTSNLTTLDVSHFDTSNVTTMAHMFDSTGLTSLDLSNFDTSNVTNMAAMFYNSSNLTSLDISSFNTSNVTNMGLMFYGTSGLTSLDLSSFDTSKVTDMGEMFRDASSLTTINLSSFTISNSTEIGGMFCGINEELDISSLDTSNISDTSKMYKCVADSV